MNVVFKVYWNNPIEMTAEAGTQHLTFEVPLGAIISNPSSGGGTASYPSFIGNADKVLTVNDTEDDVEWTTAVTQVYVDQEIVDLNAILSTSISSKAAVNYVDIQDELLQDQINLKADTNYVDTQDGLLQDQIDLKADAIAISQSLDTKADAMATSQSLALKADLIGGLIPASQLPSYVDDVLNFPDLASFPFVGEDGKIYVAEDTNKTYRWGGSSYVESGGGGVALGETSSTAYRGDNGKIAYDHSLSQGNPHNTTTSDINEGTKLFFTESRVNQTVLTGLNTSTATPALATDQLLAAIGKLQAQINSMGSGGGGSSGGMTWVDVTTLAGYAASNVDQANSKIEVSKQNGMIWIRGHFVLSNNVSAGSPIVSYTQTSYLVDSTFATGAANISPLSMSAVMLMTPSSGGLGTISYLKFNPSRVAGNSINFNLSPYPTSLAAQGYFIVPTCLGKALNP